MCSKVRAVKMALLFGATVAMALAICISYVSGSALDFGRSIGLLNEWNTSTTWSRRNIFQSSSIVPSGWTFTIWGLIFAFQALWLAYCWTTLCRTAYDEGPLLCEEPDLAPNGLLAWHFASSLCTMTWILLADSIDFHPILLIPQVCVIVAAVVCLISALATSYYSLQKDKPLLVNYGKRLDYWLTVAFVQNGISLYASWVTIATCLNVDLMLVFVVKLEGQISSFICLSFLTAIITAYVIADLGSLDRVTRFVFAPHLVVGWACAGSLAKNFTAWSPNTIITIVLAGIAALGLLLKLIGVAIRSRTSPLLTGRTYHVK